MAVINDYVTTGRAVSMNRGGDVVAIAVDFEVLAADSDTSKYRIARLNANLVPLRIDINCDVITGGNDYDLGLYQTLEKGGTAVDADIFMNGVDLSGGKALGSEQNGLATLPIASIGSQLYELAGESGAAPDMEYDLVLTANTVGTGTGTVAIRALFAKTA